VTGGDPTDHVTDPQGPTTIEVRDGRRSMRGGYAGLSFCTYMMRTALRLSGRFAGVRLVADLD